MYWSPTHCTLQLNFCPPTSGSLGSSNSQSFTPHGSRVIRPGDVYTGVSVIRYRKILLPCACAIHHSSNTSPTSQDPAANLADQASVYSVSSEHDSKNEHSTTIIDRTSRQECTSDAHVSTYETCPAATSAQQTVTSHTSHKQHVQQLRAIAQLGGLHLHAYTSPNSATSTSSTNCSSSKGPGSGANKMNNSDTCSSSNSKSGDMYHMQGLIMQNYKLTLVSTPTTHGSVAGLRSGAVMKIETILEDTTSRVCNMPQGHAADMSDDDGNNTSAAMNGSHTDKNEKQLAAIGRRKGQPDWPSRNCHTIKGRSSHDVKKNSNEDDNSNSCDNAKEAGTSRGTSETDFVSGGSKIVCFAHAHTLPRHTVVELAIQFRGVVQADCQGALYSTAAIESSQQQQQKRAVRHRTQATNTHNTTPNDGNNRANNGPASDHAGMFACLDAELLTHFEVALARHAFPCPDDTHYRLYWHLKTIQLPACYHTVISNAPMAHDRVIALQEVRQCGFELCGPLPAYALAVAAWAGQPLCEMRSSVIVPSVEYFYYANREARNAAEPNDAHKHKPCDANFKDDEDVQVDRDGCDSTIHMINDVTKRNKDEADDHDMLFSTEAKVRAAASKHQQPHNTTNTDDLLRRRMLTTTLPVRVLASPRSGTSPETMQRVLTQTCAAVRVLQDFFQCPLPLLQGSRSNNTDAHHSNSNSNSNNNRDYVRVINEVELCVLIVPTMPYISGMEHHCCVFLKDVIFASPGGPKVSHSVASACSRYLSNPPSCSPPGSASSKQGKESDQRVMTQVQLIVHEIAHHWMGNALGLPFAVKEGVCQVMELTLGSTLLGKPMPKFHALRGAAALTTRAKDAKVNSQNNSHNNNDSGRSRKCPATKQLRGREKINDNIVDVEHGHEFTGHTYQTALLSLTDVVARHGWTDFTHRMRRLVRDHILEPMMQQGRNDDVDEDDAYSQCDDNSHDEECIHHSACSAEGEGVLVQKMEECTIHTSHQLRLQQADNMQASFLSKETFLTYFKDAN